MLFRAMIAAAALVAFAATAPAQTKRKSATAAITDAQGKAVGTAKFKETKAGVQMQVTVSNLPPGERAIHVHNAGQCDPPDYKTAGPHFNPAQKKHGMQNPDGHHAGDLPNLVVDAKGKGRLQVILAGVTLDGEGANSLFHQGHTAVVIHEKADDMKTDPAGNAGNRIACGVIK
jgi:Cu-Zn family superoxide dismutase